MTEQEIQELKEWAEAQLDKPEVDPETYYEGNWK